MWRASVWVCYCMYYHAKFPTQEQSSRTRYVRMVLFVHMSDMDANIMIRHAYDYELYRS